MIVYGIAPAFFESAMTRAIVRLLLSDCDVDAVERTIILVAGGFSPLLMRAWLIMVSTPIVVLPVERSPMINSR